MAGPALLPQIQREVGRRVREARVAADLSQEEAAAKAGIDYKRYQRIELGAVNVTLRTVARLAAALRVSPWDLLRPGQK